MFMLVSKPVVCMYVWMWTLSGLVSFVCRSHHAAVARELLIVRPQHDRSNRLAQCERVNELKHRHTETVQNNQHRIVTF